MATEQLPYLDTFATAAELSSFTAAGKSLGLTQAAAAQKTGVATRTWIAWENSQNTPGRLAQRLLTAAFPGQL